MSTSTSQRCACDYPGTPAIACSRLKIIELYRVSFEDTKEIRVALRLITNSPNLKELHVLVSYCYEEFGSNSAIN